MCKLIMKGQCLGVELWEQRICTFDKLRGPVKLSSKKVIVTFPWIIDDVNSLSQMWHTCIIRNEK
jgi:hypothetical protein